MLLGADASGAPSPGALASRREEVADIVNAAVLRAAAETSRRGRGGPAARSSRLELVLRQVSPPPQLGRVSRARGPPMRQTFPLCAQVATAVQEVHELNHGQGEPFQLQRSIHSQPM